MQPGSCQTNLILTNSVACAVIGKRRQQDSRPLSLHVWKCRHLVSLCLSRRSRCKQVRSLQSRRRRCSQVRSPQSTQENNDILVEGESNDTSSSKDHTQHRAERGTLPHIAHGSGALKQPIGVWLHMVLDHYVCLVSPVLGDFYICNIFILCAICRRDRKEGHYTSNQFDR